MLEEISALMGTIRGKYNGEAILRQRKVIVDNALHRKN